VIVDTHIHLDDARYEEDFEAVIARAKEAGVTRFIIPGADPQTLPRAIALAEAYEEIYFAVGVHPYDAIHYDRRALDRAVTHEKCVAVGECGLDYYRLPEDEGEIRAEKLLQRQVFIDQIALAAEHDKPLIVHIRDASRDAQEILEQYAAPRGGVLHCYNADHALLSLAKRNFYFGIGGVLTFKNARKLVEVYPQIPQERLLIETDGPYLTPHPYRGQRNEPAYCRIIAQKMAELSTLSLEQMIQITRANTRALFGI